MNLVLRFKIFSIVERFRPVHISGIGKEAIFRQESLGWYVCLEPGFFLFSVGEKPANFKEGMAVKLTMEPDNA